MGAYLNKPITEKVSESGSGNGVVFGATSMQGWRVNQEDAHNCVVELKDDWSIFAVYDGHGGSEVSKYTALHFPQFLLEKEFWSQEDISSALQEIFVQFDDVLRSDPVMKELKKMANEGKENSPNYDSDDENDRIQTIEESAMPLEQLLKQYGYAFIRNGGGATTGPIVHEEEEPDAGSETEGTADGKKRPCKSPTAANRSKRAKTDAEPEIKEEVRTDETENGVESIIGNDDMKENNVDAEKPTIETVVKTKSKKIATREEKQDTAPDDDDSDDDDDADFEAGDEDEEESGEEGDEEEDDDELESDEDEGQEIILPGGGEIPGDDSGTTACVCLINKDKIVVANAGDSRAVLSRGGKAIDLSVDHKPEDEIEKTRIVRAGGIVNEDGRVNGGLNLSRALGDHSYKKNNTLHLREQMISALPDVRLESRHADDEFIVVACDGIWNMMESQEVIDFIRERYGKDCVDISNELCDHCLAENTAGDGSGCDNMTVIIVKLSNQ